MADLLQRNPRRCRSFLERRSVDKADHHSCRHQIVAEENLIFINGGPGETWDSQHARPGSVMNDGPRRELRGMGIWSVTTKGEDHVRQVPPYHRQSAERARSRRPRAVQLVSARDRSAA